MTLVAFLRARLAEDEAKARDPRLVNAFIPSIRDPGMSVAEIAMLTCLVVNPARVLAEVEAKRLRIEHYLKICEYADPAKDPDQAYVLAKGAVEYSLKLDALPYADHEDYREEWRP